MHTEISTIYWRLMVALNLVAIIWIVYVIWELVPTPVVNQSVYSQAKSRLAQGKIIDHRLPRPWR